MCRNITAQIMNVQHELRSSVCNVIFNTSTYFWLIRSEDRSTLLFFLIFVELLPTDSALPPNMHVVFRCICFTESQWEGGRCRGNEARWGLHWDGKGKASFFTLTLCRMTGSHNGDQWEKCAHTLINVLPCRTGDLDFMSLTQSRKSNMRAWAWQDSIFYYHFVSEILRSLSAWNIAHTNGIYMQEKYSTHE